MVGTPQPANVRDSGPYEPDVMTTAEGENRRSVSAAAQVGSRLRNTGYPIVSSTRGREYPGARRANRLGTALSGATGLVASTATSIPFSFSVRASSWVDDSAPPTRCGG